MQQWTDIVHPPKILLEAPQIYLGNYGLSSSKVNEAANHARLCSLKKVVYAREGRGIVYVPQSARQQELKFR